MKKFKYLFLLAASVMFFACSSGGDVPANEEPQPEDEPKIEVEELPAGVEIGDETVQLNNIQLQEVVNVDADNSTLTFDASLPEEQIPQKGQIILQYSPTDELPYGFLGRVTNIKKSGDKIIVETEVPALDEAFDEFVINYDSKSAYTGSRADDEVDIGNDILIEQDGYVNFTTTVSKKDPDVSCAISFGLNTKINTTIDNNKNINDQFYSFGIRVSSNVSYTVKNEKEIKERTDFGEGKKFALPNLSPAVMGAVQFFWASELKGSEELSLNISNTIEGVYNVESKKGGIPQFTKVDSGTSNVMPTFKPEFKLKGEVFAGLGFRIDLRLFGRKELTVGIGTEAGPEITAEIDLLGNPKNLYTEYKDSFVELKGALKNKAYVTAKLMGLNKEWDKDLLPIRWEIAKRYIFPEFKDLSLDDSDKAYCSATLERDVLFPMGVGFSQYDEYDELVKHSKDTEYIIADKFSNPLTASFSNDGYYTYWTYVKWGDKYIKCKEVEDTSIVGCWASPDYRRWKNGESNFEAIVYKFNSDGTFTEFCYSDMCQGGCYSIYNGSYTYYGGAGIINLDYGSSSNEKDLIDYHRISETEYDEIVAYGKRYGKPHED